MRALLLGLLFVSSVHAANAPPTITGTPTSTVMVGQRYSFTPVAKDPEGKKLNFVIKNRPSWITFSYQSGSISGTPTAAHVGKYSNIIIYVRDASNTVAMRTFSISVLQVTGASATLSWQKPTTNTDGSALTNLAGYRINYGPSASAMTSGIVIPNPSVTTYIVEQLSSGTWYFNVVAINSAGAESAPSNTASKKIG